MTGRTAALPTALATLLLALLLVACVVAGHRTLAAGQLETTRMQAALTVVDAAATASSRYATDLPARDKALQDLQIRHGHEVALVFAAGMGGVDEFGISQGQTLTYGATEAGPLAPALLERSKDAQSAGEAALQHKTPLDVTRVVSTLADGRRVVALPFRTHAGAPELGGVTGLILRTPTPLQIPLWIWLLPLCLAVLVVGARRLMPTPSNWPEVAVLILGALLLVTILPPLKSSQPGGITILASDWLVPHGPWPDMQAAGLPWLVGGALGLAIALGLCIQGLASVLVALRRDVAPYLYVGPALLATGVLVFVPFAVGVGLSFVSRDGTFIGLDNYAEVVRTAMDPSSSTHFGRTLAMTVLWTVLNVVLHVTLGLGLALVLNRKHLKARAIYRLLLIVPWAVPSYITALTWKWLFNTQYGPINAMLTGLGMAKVDWLGDSVVTNFAANLATNAWLGFPFMMVISLGALQSIPGELYEAAEIDGASSWQQFRHVTLPLLKPALFPAVILGTIWTFNAFNVIYLVSGGGPEHKTDILITEAYHAFTVLRRTGLAAAYSVLIFLVLLGYTVVTNRKTKATEAISA
jgi:ABC-type sugar transport system permease subunit